MKRAHYVIVRACSYLKAHARAFTIGLALVSMASLPSPAWGQWTGGPTGPVYYNGGNVGIGTTTPQAPLDVKGILLIRDRGDNCCSDLRLNVGAAGGETHLYSYADGHFSIYKYLNGGVGEALTIRNNGYVGIGTIHPQYLLSVDGTIGAKDIIVTNTGWSDYVFRPGYRLRPLSEVSAYMQAHHHLPEIPSEAEVKEKGVSVADMQVKLLAKVEELTLYTIQQDKANQELRRRIAKLETTAAGSGARAAGR